MTTSKKGKETMRLLITGGGTGGHLFPAIATAQCLIKNAPGSELLFVGTKRKMDKATLEQYDFKVRSITCYGLKGKNVLELIKALLVLPISCLQAIITILSFKPDVVMGVGGYVTGPVVAMAKLLGKPTIIHEQNSIPGLANRKLGSFVDRICLSLPDSGNIFDTNKVVFTGNPVRQELLAIAGSSAEDKTKPFVITVLGGSQGAHGVNTLVTETICNYLLKSGTKIKIIHQTGDLDVEFVKKRYEEAGIDAEVQPFFRDMAALYEKTQLVLSRAGATTLCELAVLGKPAILFPYPHAADNHQEKNADYYVAGGGAIKFDEKLVLPQRLAEVIQGFVEDEQKLSKASQEMTKLGFPDAAERIVTTCFELHKRNGVEGVSSKNV